MKLVILILITFLLSSCGFSYTDNRIYNETDSTEQLVPESENSVDSPNHREFTNGSIVSEIN